MMETLLHVLADRLEDVVERVLGDASDTRPIRCPPHRRVGPAHLWIGPRR
ncbi:MAG: hypothetical protein IPH91_10885 [Elusimicrobia bacterium]|nr:hypothetical protein [Elusimicrobiota bacterium]